MSEMRYFSTEEAAARLDRTPRYITHLCQQGLLDGAFKDGKSWKIPEDSLARLSVPRRNRKKPSLLREEKLPLYAGSTSFPQVSSGCYADKTLLIRDLLSQYGSATLIARPQGFGKSLALSMLQTFFEPSGRDLTVYFRNRQIWKHHQLCREHLGKHPVISFSFRDTAYTSWEEAFSAVRLLLKEEFIRHLSGFSPDLLQQEEAAFVQDILSETAQEVPCSRALRNLSLLLQRHFHAPCVILIDEFDAPVRTAFANGYGSKALSFFRNFLSAGLSDNPAVLCSVLTGTFCGEKSAEKQTGAEAPPAGFSWQALVGGIDNLTIDTVLDDRFSSYFGFTEGEVEKILSSYGKKGIIDGLRAWYGHYRFGSSALFCPWSVTACLANEGRFRSYRSEETARLAIGEMLRNCNVVITEQLLFLLQGYPVRVLLDMEGIAPRTENGVYAVFSHLLSAGYLSLSETRETEQHPFGTFAWLELQNMEARRVFHTQILAWTCAQVGTVSVTDLETAMLNQDSAGLPVIVIRYAKACIQSFAGAADAYWNCLVLGLAAVLSVRYRLRIGQGTAGSDFSLQFTPRPEPLLKALSRAVVQADLPGIILEFKAAENADAAELSRTAVNCCTQISLRGDALEMHRQGIRDVVRIGLAYCGSQVETVTVNG